MVQNGFECRAHVHTEKDKKNTHEEFSNFVCIELNFTVANNFSHRLAMLGIESVSSNRNGLSITNSSQIL